MVAARLSCHLWCLSLFPSFSMSREANFLTRLRGEHLFPCSPRSIIIQVINASNVSKCRVYRGNVGSHDRNPNPHEGGAIASSSSSISMSAAQHVWLSEFHLESSVSLHDFVLHCKTGIEVCMYVSNFVCRV